MTEFFIRLIGHERYNDVQTMTQLFYPNGKYTLTEAVHPTGITIESTLSESCCAAFIYEGGLLLAKSDVPLGSAEKSVASRAIKTALYQALSARTGLQPQWGILTGIRPAKLARELMKDGGTRQTAAALLMRNYLVAPAKAVLATEVAEYETRLLQAEHTNELPSLYIGIPFCPTRCVYCSFTSYPLAQYQGRVDEYLRCLIKEIDSLPDTGLDCLYVGGGTPTSLDAAQLDVLLSAVLEKFGMPLGEFTIEAGRPDTITEAKLSVLRAHGVRRLSINPQTMNDETLKKIGRRHSVQDIVDAFHMAQAMGFENINMDLIVGLPEETPEMVAATMRQIKALNPASVTVHTLAVKRASRLNESLTSYALADYETVEAMLAITADYAAQMQMAPYYMYRQKNMLGNFENVGYCRPGYHSPYNIKIMEETQTIIAAGAGAITKLVRGENIERIFNVKNVDEYIRRIDEMIHNKKDVFDAALH